MKTILAITTALFLLSIPAKAVPDPALTSSGWCCIWVAPNLSPYLWDQINWWIEWNYQSQYTILREGDSDGNYWYLRLYPITDAK